MMMKKEKTAGKAKTVGTLFTGDDLKKLIFPLIIEQILAVSVGMVDTMMVSSAGEAATSGVSLVDIINVLIINIFAAVATGGAVVTSQYIGQKRKDRADDRDNLDDAYFHIRRPLTDPFRPSAQAP